MPFSPLSPAHIHFFQSILPKENVLLAETDRSRYAEDETEDFHFTPEVVLLPETAEQVAAILKFCTENKLPVTPRGAGTGLSGGALPLHNGVVLSMEKMNKILNIDTLNLQATVEPGVITEVFQKAVAEKGLFYPPDPASKGTCFIGGNLAHNSGGQSGKIWCDARLRAQLRSSTSHGRVHLDGCKCLEKFYRL